MSVSLITLRLEVSEDTYLPLLHYSNQGTVGKSDVTHLTYAEATANVKVIPGPAASVPTEDSTRHRGKRQFDEIIIETYTADLNQPKMEDKDDGIAKDFPKEEPVEEKELQEDTHNSHTDKNTGDKITFNFDDTNNTECKTTSRDKEEEVKNATVESSNQTKDKQQTDAADARQKVKESIQTAEKKHSKMKAGPSKERRPVKETRSKKSMSPLTDQVKDTAEERRGREGAANALASTHVRSQSPVSPSNTICYFSGNPSVELTEGIIHLYKENQMTSLKDEVVRSEMLCMLSVPAKMTSADLLQFVAPVETWIENMKIIRDKTPNRYMVLAKFRNQKYADEFYMNFNNITYNSLEPDICHLAYVSKLESVKSSEGGSLPIPGHTELPVCPVCLERMDESVDGILTILCNHSFHSNCLAQWEDTSCPVCRYVQTPEAVEDHRCFECDSQDSLWICLICAHVGCGRYVGGHAYRHFIETQHTYSLQLGNSRVWDYAGDNYVHRLVQNKGDGKLVQVDEGGNVMQEEKLDSITLEYTYLLTNQLESQRRYFEEKIEHIEKEALTQVETVEAQSKAALEECKKLEQKLAISHKEKQTLEKKSHQLQTRLGKVLNELQEEREMNKSLMKNQLQWQTKVTQLEAAMLQKDKEMAEVQEQLRDVMFYLEAQNKLATVTDVSKEEIQDGQIVIGASGGTPQAKKGRKKTR